MTRRHVQPGHDWENASAILPTCTLCVGAHVANAAIQCKCAQLVYLPMPYATMSSICWHPLHAHICAQLCSVYECAIFLRMCILLPAVQDLICSEPTFTCIGSLPQQHHRLAMVIKVFLQVGRLYERNVTFMTSFGAVRS